MYKEDFRIGSEHRGYFIFIPNKIWSYLTKNNIIKTWGGLLEDNSISGAEGLIFFNTRQKAEKALDKFLKGQNMNLQVKRDQCIADIGVLQSNLAEIDKNIKISKDPLNKVKNYISENLCYGHSATIKNMESGVYVVVPMPICNRRWTFAAWDWAKNFCEEFTKAGVYPYLIHGYFFQDNRNLWIKVK